MSTKQVRKETQTRTEDSNTGEKTGIEKEPNTRNPPSWSELFNRLERSTQTKLRQNKINYVIYGLFVTSWFCAMALPLVLGHLMVVTLAFYAVFPLHLKSGNVVDLLLHSSIVVTCVAIPLIPMFIVLYRIFKPLF